MGSKIELRPGQRFGRLTVLHLHHELAKSGNILWLCECLCGNRVEVRGASLVAGHIQSCDCLRRERVAEANRRRAANSKTILETSFEER